MDQIYGSGPKVPELASQVVDVMAVIEYLSEDNDWSTAGKLLYDKVIQICGR